MRPEATARDGRSFIEAARRAQIVECAIETIASEGYSGASLARIAKLAGISKGVISYHFADKDELIQQVIVEVLQAFDSYMRPLVQAQRPSAAAMLRTYIESNVAFMTAHRSYVLALVEVFKNAHRPQSRPLVDPKDYESGLMELEQILRRGQRSGEFRRFATRTMAVSIRAAIDAIAPQMVTNRELDLDDYGRELATTFRLAARAESL
jgi:TetR/AcrR family transcriptional regulator, fatty acid metabolism regulator protein